MRYLWRSCRQVAVKIGERRLRRKMFQHANYFLNFQKLLGIAKGVKVRDAAACVLCSRP